MPAASRRRLVAAAALALAAVARAGDAEGGARGPEVVRLDLVPGRMGAVTFTHGAHAALRHAGGAPVSCRDCHHDLPAGGGGTAQRCLACHAALDEPPRAIAAMGGRVAPPLVRRKEDRALDHQTVLFHAWCRDCHKQSSPPGKRLHLCKVCHERGVGQDVMHGDPAAQGG
jgi:Zn finger protein HypA/HybF involved in hydrogenase expression